MLEEPIYIKSDRLRLEALLNNSPGERAVVITHPHPLYGGEMRNNVVESVLSAYSDIGYTTLRFNFRGTGSSEGSYDSGIGEQEDVKAALRYVYKLGKTKIHLAGYSFGCWVNARGIDKFREAGSLVMISPPVNFVDFSFLSYNPKISLIIAGSKDEIGKPSLIQEMSRLWNPSAVLHVIQGADHFYLDRTEDIKKIIKAYLTSVE